MRSNPPSRNPGSAVSATTPCATPAASRQPMETPTVGWPSAALSKGRPTNSVAPGDARAARKKSSAATEPIAAASSCELVDGMPAASNNTSAR